MPIAIVLYMTLWKKDSEITWSMQVQNTIHKMPGKNRSSSKSQSTLRLSYGVENEEKVR